MTVPVISIVCMFISLLVAFGTPVALFLLWRKRFGLRLVPALVGAAAFFLFAMVLEPFLHRLVLVPFGGNENALVTPAQPLLYALYGGFAAGIFEETARFLSFTLLKRRYTGLGTALSYGIGHGGIEAILVLGFTMISNLILAFSTGSGMGEAAASAAALAATPPQMFLLGALERLSAIAVHLSLSVLVYCAATDKARVWLYPLAIVLHAAVNFAPGLYQAGVLPNIYLVEGFLLVAAAGLVCVARLVYKRFGEVARKPL